MARGTEASFDALLEEVIESLPSGVQGILREIPIIVEDAPPQWALDELGIEEAPEESDLCGLHSGIPLTEQGRIFGDQPSPQAIHLFRGPIERLAGGHRAALRKQIKITLLHEIGHHHGMSEEELKELGYE